VANDPKDEKATPASDLKKQIDRLPAEKPTSLADLAQRKAAERKRPPAPPRDEKPKDPTP
jgi:hypothetical protein